MEKKITIPEDINDDVDGWEDVLITNDLVLRVSYAPIWPRTPHEQKWKFTVFNRPLFKPEKAQHNFDRILRVSYTLRSSKTANQLFSRVLVLDEISNSEFTILHPDPNRAIWTTSTKNWPNVIAHKILSHLKKEVAVWRNILGLLNNSKSISRQIMSCHPSRQPQNWNSTSINNGNRTPAKLSCQVLNQFTFVIEYYLTRRPRTRNEWKLSRLDMATEHRRNQH